MALHNIMQKNKYIKGSLWVIAFALVCLCVLFLSGRDVNVGELLFSVVATVCVIAVICWLWRVKQRVNP